MVKSQSENTDCTNSEEGALVKCPSNLKEARLFSQIK